MRDRPLHEQIAAALRDRITGGELAVGDVLPSEAQLCRTWGVSRGPVRQALQALRIAGVIGGGPGKPPVVLSPTMTQPFGTFLSFSRWVTDIGSRPGQRTIEVAKRRAGSAVAAALGVGKGTQIVQVLRVRLLDDQPVMIERSSFVEPVGRLLFAFDCDSGSIYSYLESHGVDLTRARHVIDAVPATDEDARLLGLAHGAALLREQRHAGGGDGDIYEYSDDRYRPDYVNFCIENNALSPTPLQRLATTA